MFKQNATVKFNAHHGSIGIVRAISGDRLYVEWNYGRDVRGEAITATSSFPGDTRELLEIPRDLYARHCECPAWSERQKVVDAEINSVLG